VLDALRCNADEVAPYMAMEKGQVLQEARVFNDAQLDVRRCHQVVTKLLYLLNHGETFTHTEATEVFFASTKLFQSNDSGLRRMVYLIIKDLAPLVDDCIIVTSSLMKDMSGKSELYRANAIRVLCRITDANLLQQVERYMKQAIVDRAPVVASAALASGLHLSQRSPDSVKRWSSEVYEAVQSGSGIVNFHALALLHQMRRNDRLAVNKLVTQMTQPGMRSRQPLVQCLLIRYVSRIVQESPGGEDGQRPFYSFLTGCLKHNSEMVILEASRAIASLPGVTLQELQPAVSVLQLFLSSSKPSLRYGACRTLSSIAVVQPTAVSNCNYDLEDLAKQDTNISVSTVALTTLLTLATESNIDRLMNLATECIPNIHDDFRVVVVQSVQKLSTRLPHKFQTLLHFLASMLREQGGFEFKKAVVDSVLSITKRVPDAKDEGLSHLCEFIEDCEFPYLSSQVLYLLGEEGPRSKDPSKYLRYIFNRVILEAAIVRSAAVGALAKFGAQCEDLRPSVVVLLRRCLNDNDDEVRDRVTFDISLLEAKPGSRKAERGQRLLASKPLACNTAELEQRLSQYIKGPTDEPFDISQVPVESAPSIPGSEPQKQQPNGMLERNGPDYAAATSTHASAAAADMYASQLDAVQQLAHVGKLFKSSALLQLTENETEYRVTCLKHVFENHIVFQMNCENTVREQELENVTVLMEPESDDFSEEVNLSLDRIPHENEGAGVAYVCMRKAKPLTGGRLLNTLKFSARERDPSTGELEEEGYPDEYQLEDIEVSFADHIIPTRPSTSFKEAWDDLPEESEKTDDYGLGTRNSIQEVLEQVMSMFGMAACDGTDVVGPNARSHTAVLSGTVVGDRKLLMKVQLGMSANNNVAMKLAARSPDPDIASAVHEVLAE